MRCTFFALLVALFPALAPAGAPTDLVSASSIAAFDVNAACKYEAQRLAQDHPEQLANVLDICIKSELLTKRMIDGMPDYKAKRYEVEFCRERAIDDDKAYIEFFDCLQRQRIERQFAEIERAFNLARSRGACDRVSDADFDSCRLSELHERFMLSRAGFPAVRQDALNACLRKVLAQWKSYQDLSYCLSRSHSAPRAGVR